LRKLKRDFTRHAQEVLAGWTPSYCKQFSREQIFEVIDFFCGCGGMSLGFACLFPFFKVIGGCDIDGDAAATFRHNFNVPAIVTDVGRLTDQKGLSAFVKKLGRRDEKPLILIGCAPCQGFSAHRKKNWHKTDSRNTLVEAFASIAVKLNPECIVMENVPEILARKYWNHFEEARSIFHDAGYIVKQSIYNAASFGVPQERFRAIIIAMKRDFLLPVPLLTDPREYVTVRQAIGNLPPVSPGQTLSDPLHRSARHHSKTIDIIKAVPKNGGSRPHGVGPKCLDRVAGFYDVYGRLYWDKPAITITHYARNPASGRFIHPEQDRGLTTREAALFQSFPYGFEFEGSFDSIFKQIGEAVPPRLACGIAASVLVELLSPPSSEKDNVDSVPCVVEPVSNSYSSVIAGLKLARK
jgi:DNA (cytosine-5)-methyltransferase 1